MCIIEIFFLIINVFIETNTILSIDIKMYFTIHKRHINRTLIT